MSDPRVERLAGILVDYSVKVGKGDVVMIDFSGVRALPLVRAVYRRCLLRGAIAEYTMTHEVLTRTFFETAGGRALGDLPRHRLQAMTRATVYVGINATEDTRLLAGVPMAKLMRREKVLRPLVNRRVEHTRWVITRYPTTGLAQEARMSLKDFEDLYFRACNIDWPSFSRRLTRLRRMLRRAANVHIRSSDTDLRFSVRGVPAVACDGLRNMPDGEVFTAPVRDSVEGHIVYNVPCLYQGKEFDGVRFVFKRGRIVEATCRTGSRAELRRILDNDRGARYIGEFSFGLNPNIRHGVKNTLFDEKIFGTIHFTPGQAYSEADNGNRSSVHWDLVKSLKDDGEVFFDGRLIQKDGLFVAEGLRPLNPRKGT